MRTESDETGASTEHRRLATLSTPIDTVSLIGAMCGAPAPTDERARITIKSEYGRGVMMYFQYIVFLCVLNALLAIVGAILYAAAASDASGLNASGLYSGLSGLFLASFAPTSRPAWYALTTVALLLGLAAGPVFSCVGARYQARWRGAGRVDEDSGGTSDRIEANAVYSSGTRAIRRTMSIVIFAIIVVGQGVLMYYLHVALEQSGDQIVSLTISVIIAVLNIVWKMVSRQLTQFEVHISRTAQTEWDTGKVFFIKIANVMSLYVVKFLITARFGEAADSTDPAANCPVYSTALDDCRCPLAGMAWQFFYLIILDLTLSNALEIVLPAVQSPVMRWLGFTKGRGDASVQQEFDLTEEYVEVLYRQFIIYLGFTVFPLMAIIGFVGTVAEFWLDKYRLVVMCRKPEVREEPIRPILLTICHMVVAVAALGSFPNGMAVIFAGYNIQGNCAFWPS